MASLTKDQLLALIREGKPMLRRDQFRLTALLSVPGIVAQLSSILMQYIDASMVGSLGADDSASIGLVSTTMWLFGGICSAACNGFSVQVAHLIGANDFSGARDVLRQALTSIIIFGLAIAAIGVIISGPLPGWLGGGEAIRAHASAYFLIVMLCIPLLALDMLASGMLRSAGNIKVPAILNTLMCLLDVVFNFIFIFPTHHFTVLGMHITLPGLGLGVIGAALGTAVAETLTAIGMVSYVCFKSKELKLTQDHGSYRPTGAVLRRAWKIGFPMGLQQMIMTSAQIVITTIVAPLGSIAIAANSFAITAESLCYMPGYGIAEAATTLVGQSIGAKRKELSRQFAGITVASGMVVMTLMGVLLFAFAPAMMGMLSPVQAIVDQGATCLRIEAFAEPFFAAAIVCYGAMVGAGDTLIPSFINVGTMWCVRITLAAVLAPQFGLVGVWIAMASELTMRGLLFLLRLKFGKWNKLAETGGQKM